MQRCGGLVLMALFVVCMALSGCSNPDDKLALDINECADTLREAVPFQDALTEISGDMIAVLYQIPEQDAVKQKVYVGSGATAEEIAVFEAVDYGAVQRIEAAVWQRVADQKAAFEDYLPAELPKLTDPFLFVKNKYVILCVSDHNDKAKTELNKLLNKKQ